MDINRLTNILKSKQVSLKSKITLYKEVYSYQTNLYECETWHTTEGNEDKIAILERILRRINGPKINNRYHTTI